MSAKIHLSYRIDILAEALVQFLDEHPRPLLTQQTVLVPNAQMKQWLTLEIAKRTSIAMGLKFVSIDELYPYSLSSLEMFCLVYQEIIQSKEEEVQSYLGGKKERALELARQLAALFDKYGEYGPDLFQGTGWQRAMLQKLFTGNRKLPVQQSICAKEQLICFGVDSLAPVYWEFLFKAPALAIFLFSPCVDFWEDLCSDRERRQLNRYWKKQGTSHASREQLDSYLRKCPRNLANWGKLGRETLKIFDRFDLETEEIYPSLEPDTMLKQMQFDLLTFQERETYVPDDSVKLFLTGSSRLKEVECLRDEILRLSVPFSEIAVVAPDIQPYVPLIEFVFAGHIPYRISGVDIAGSSPFRQGVLRMLDLENGRWEAEELLTLFETASFAKKQNWDRKKLETLREWIGFARIDWGKDADHRNQTLQKVFEETVAEDFGSWEKGLGTLLDTIVYFSPSQINPEVLEEIITLIFNLQQLPLKGEKTLSEWADVLEKMTSDYLTADEEDEADAAVLSAFHFLLREMRNFAGDGIFPLAVVRELFKKPCFGQIHASKLHAVRIGSLNTPLPAKALFLIGMDEESFPRLRARSSIDLLKGKGPDPADQDRYTFLQAIFSAQDYLRISYGHLSADEGKPINPSLLVEELLRGVDVATRFEMPVFQPKPKHFPWPGFSGFTMPRGELTLSVKDLRTLARHPWKFYLQKAHGIYLDTSLEETFHLQKSQLVRDEHSEGAPRGRLGEALRMEASDERARLEKQKAEWNLQSFSLVLRENCKEAHFEEGQYIVPAVQLDWDGLKVRIIGEIEEVSRRGLICKKDDIGSLLKVWPEALITAHVLQARAIYPLKAKEPKELIHVEKSLRSFIEYYFAAERSPSPLMPEWADALLRKNATDLEKKIEKGFAFDDPVVDWVLQRVDFPTAVQIYEEWVAILKGTFEELASLYPVKGKHAAV